MGVCTLYVGLTTVDSLVGDKRTIIGGYVGIYDDIEPVDCYSATGKSQQTTRRFGDLSTKCSVSQVPDNSRLSSLTYSLEM